MRLDTAPMPTTGESSTRPAKMTQPEIEDARRAPPSPWRHPRCRLPGQFVELSGGISVSHASRGKEARQARRPDVVRTFNQGEVKKNAKRGPTRRAGSPPPSPPPNHRPARSSSAPTFKPPRARASRAPILKTAPLNCRVAASRCPSKIPKSPRGEDPPRIRAGDRRPQVASRPPETAGLCHGPLAPAGTRKTPSRRWSVSARHALPAVSPGRSLQSRRTAADRSVDRTAPASRSSQTTSSTSSTQPLRAEFGVT